MNNLGNDVVRQAMDNIGQAAEQPASLILDERKAEKADAAGGTAEAIVNKRAALKNDGTGSDTAKSFVGLPIESLICAPLVAGAKAQQELTAVYVDGIMKLAYQGSSGENTNNNEKKTNTLDFTINRPVAMDDGSMTTKKFTINAPLLSLVPVPAFTMDELTVDFEMEVKNSDMSQTETKADVQSTVNYKSWFGLSASITGNVSSDSTHKRASDSSATYKIYARAIQQQPSEGMAKLTALFSQMMEPIPASSKSGE